MEINGPQGPGYSHDGATTPGAACPDLVKKNEMWCPCFVMSSGVETSRFNKNADEAFAGNSQ
jgi:hypothetical protein